MFSEGFVQTFRTVTHRGDREFLEDFQAISVARVAADFGDGFAVTRQIYWQLKHNVFSGAFPIHWQFQSHEVPGKLSEFQVRNICRKMNWNNAWPNVRIYQR